jgi:SAM-dependent methyltransferase
MNRQTHICRLCNKQLTAKIKDSTIKGILTPSNFRITDAHYGMTLELYQCSFCGFIQCPRIVGVHTFYELMDDEAYEHTRAARSLQANKILDVIVTYRAPQGTLLDIGAGSGILVELALKRGYQAEGIEPSRWLQARAQQRGLPVYQGVFPADAPHKTFDIITVIDVIEHVDNPVDFMTNCHARLSTGGLLVLITPDVGSLCAKLFGWKWWHYRVGHIGYFSRRTISFLINNTGFTQLNIRSAGWYFTLRYLLERAASYLPFRIRVPRMPWLDNIIVPLYLRDSFLVLCIKNED